jgi:phage terminase large subunit-like protein
LSLYGNEQPRLLAGSLPAQSRGQLAVDLAAALGQPLLPWQKFAMIEGMKVNGDQYVSKQVGILVARQNGKSHMMRIRILAGMLLFGESWIAMAQKLELSELHLDWAIDAINEHGWLRAEVAKVSRVNGDKYIKLKNGAKWSVAAATAKSVRGQTGNLWIDEIREIPSEAYTAASPVTRAVKNAQTWVTSNAGDAHSIVLNKMRSNALALNDPKLLWMEWSADPQLSLTDKRGWYQANPALGHLIDESVIETAAKTDTPEAFRTESLCLWIEALESPWTYGSVEAASMPDMEMDPERTTFWSIDVSPDRKRADLVGAQHLPDGRIGFAIAQSWEADGAVDDVAIASEVSQIVRQFESHVIAYDKWSASSIAARLQSAGFRVQDITAATFAQACDEMMIGLNSGRLSHDGNPDLMKHFNACAKRNASDGGWRVIRNGSATHISAACASIMATYSANANPEEQSFAFG